MIKQFLLILIGILLISSASFVIAPINEKRKEWELTAYDIKKGEAPEVVVATKLLGSVKSLMIDFLWLRAIELQEKGEYFELIQLHNMICKLETRIPVIWTHAAWNLAYNVSKEIPDEDRQWQYIMAGINLLRFEGLQSCPKEYAIYEQLAWFFHHKIGSSTDGNNDIYKKLFARDMEFLFGSDFHFDQLENIPKKLEEILQDEKMKSMWSEGFSDSVFLYDYFEYKAGQSLGSERVLAFLKKFADMPELKTIELFYRRKLIYDKARIEAEVAFHLEKEYGYLDWRSAYTHGLYWVMLAKKRSVVNKISTDRMETYLLNGVFHFGKVFSFKDKNGYLRYEFSPDLDKAEIVHKRYLHYFEKYPLNYGSSTFYVAYRHLLETIVFEFFATDRLDEAQKYFDESKQYVNEIKAVTNVQEYVKEAVEQTIKDGNENEKVLMIYAPIEKYYKDKFILGKPESSKYFANFVLRNYQKWKDRRQDNKLPLPKTITEIQVMVLRNMLQRYQNLVHEDYLKLLQEEEARLTKLIHQKEVNPEQNEK